MFLRRRATAKLPAAVLAFCDGLIGSQGWVQQLDGTTATVANNGSYKGTLGPLFRQIEAAANQDHLRKNFNNYLTQCKQLERLLKFVRNALTHFNDPGVKKHSTTALLECLGVSDPKPYAAWKAGDIFFR